MLSSSFRRSKYASISSANQFRIKRKLERVKKKKRQWKKSIRTQRSYPRFDPLKKMEQTKKEKEYIYI